jgi:hypothetical protein
MKRFVFSAIAFSVVFVFCLPVLAQTQTSTVVDKAEKSVNNLKKSLAKNSRYGDEVVYWFTPVAFKGCEISYRFERLSANGAERFATIVADSSTGIRRNDTLRNRDSLIWTPQNTTAAAPQQSAQATVNYNGLSTLNERARVFYNNTFPYYYSGISRKVFSLEEVITFIDLAKIDPNSIALNTSADGHEFVVFNSLKDKSAIEKRMIQGEKDVVELESDFVPVLGKKNGNKIGAAFVEAVNACRQ